jgi:Fe-S-cluster containining protein
MNPMEEVILYERLKIHTKQGSVTINIPFVCQKCGKCCREIGFPIGWQSFREIARFLKIPMEELLVYIKLNELKPCPFLKNDLCSIYPVRPGGCKLFPLLVEFKDQGIGCPGLKRIREVEDLLREEHANFISRSKWIGIKEVDRIRVKIPPKFVQKFLGTNPLKAERDLFFKLNEV